MTKAIATFYFIGFMATTMLNIASGPLSFELCLARGALWPLWITTGIPHGTTARMD